jgi:hypothetical protein
LASCCAKTPITAYIEPTCVGGMLPDMPLFLTPEHDINVPLENTYMAAWRGVPKRLASGDRIGDVRRDRAPKGTRHDGPTP